MIPLTLELVVLLASLPLVISLLRSGSGRMLCLFGGAIVTLQSADRLNVGKLAYLGLVVVLVLSAHHGSPPWELRRVNRYGALLAGALVVSGTAGVLRGGSALNVIRDVAPYLLLVVAARLAVDLGARCRPHTLLRAGTWLGMLGAAGWVTEWLSRRGYVESFRLGLPSFSLVCLAVALTSARAMTSRASAKWWSACGVVIAASLATGTRNALLLLVVPASIVVYGTVSRAGRSAATSSRRTAAQALVLIPISGLIILGAAGSVGVSVGAGVERVTGLMASDGGVSLDERRIQTEVALAEVRSNPLFGAPGRSYLVYRPASGRFTSQTTLDTPVVTAARFGVGASLASLLLLGAWWRALRPGRRSGLSVWRLAALGFAAVTVPQLAVSSVLEDKGLALAIIVLGAGALSTARAEAASGGPILSSSAQTA